MTLYVANPSKQHVVFPFRKPDGLLTFLDIPSGRQQPIGGDWTTEQKQKLVEQIERYGGRDAAEAHGKMGRFTGLLYRHDFPVDSNEIRMGHEAVVQAQEERSAAEATRSALAFDRAAQAAVGADRPGRGGRRAARTTEVTVHQELAPGERATGNEVEFSLAVDPDGRGDVKLPT